MATPARDTACRGEHVTSVLAAPRGPSGAARKSASTTSALSRSVDAAARADLERKLGVSLRGEVRFDRATCGRYAADASIYQIMPVGVVFPKSEDDVEAVLAIAAEAGVSVIARGAGTSQNGQPIGAGLIVDFSRHLNAIRGYDDLGGTIRVEPGVVLEQLNSRLRRDGWFFPVEPSTASRCTIGGMAGNNSSGARSLRYGKMVDNVLALSGRLANGESFAFGEAVVPAATRSAATTGLGERMLALASRERTEIEAVYPKVQRRVGGYNLDELLAAKPNLSHLLVGSEGTLALTTEVGLKLARLPAHRVIGVCQFPSFRSAMETTRHLVALGPVAVELIDNNVLELGAEIPIFRAALADMTRGRPNCLLVVEFAGEDMAALGSDLDRLDECMADHGFPNAVVRVVEPGRQRQIWEVRESCLNIMMSMKGDGKPVSFIEDCAVPLEHLADYTEAIGALFERYGTRGTWYAHASVGCLHVRPILNMKDANGVRQMREIAEAACDLVKRFKGSHSGEHGDGISRSDLHAKMFGPRLVRAFEEVKDAFDPDNRLNPGKIVRPYRMDDRSLLRFPPGYATGEPKAPVLDWSDWGGFGGAVGMCNNNGTCRKMTGGTMCPSFRATQSEQHSTRGRANTLRLAISGQLGRGALTSREMKETLDLCVSCKGCRRECPTGVDMARMKIEVLHHYYAEHGLPLRERLVAYLPRYAPVAARLRWLLNLRNRSAILAWAGERALGFSARRSLPEWQRPWRQSGPAAKIEDVVGDGRDVILFADTFDRYFEPENLDAAQRVLVAGGYRIHRVAPAGGRPLCCGRTFLSAGLVDQARAEAMRVLSTLGPFVAKGARIVGLEPSCLLTFRDEFTALLPRDQVKPLAEASLLFEELLARDIGRGLTRLPVADGGGRKVHVHGHCHQKSFGAMGAVESVLKSMPGLEIQTIESSCCGMAGAFGYAAETIDVSNAMAELALFPALRSANADEAILADGTSCRHQIHDGLGRQALHVARLIDQALDLPAGGPGGED
ncbi:MAG: FAD-linked oxidase C-terminal domain-containing protein [Bauldia sp.]